MYEEQNINRSYKNEYNIFGKHEYIYKYGYGLNDTHNSN